MTRADVIQEISVTCPYCWENFDILVEPDGQTQTWIEDCNVCCHPIEFTLPADGDPGTGLIVDRAQ